MKALLILLCCPFLINAMGYEKTPEEQAKELAALKYAGELKMNEGPDKEWHKANSFIQAIVNPAHTFFNENGIQFPHYKRTYYGYEFTYKETQEILEDFCGADCEVVEGFARKTINPTSPFSRLSEKEKFRIARAWLYSFLNDNYFKSDHNKEHVKKGYLEALKTGNYTVLTHLSVILAENAESLKGRIEQRKLLLLNGIR